MKNIEKKDCTRVLNLRYFSYLCRNKYVVMPDQIQISQSIDKSMAKHQEMKRLDSCFSNVTDSCQNDVITVFFC